MLWVKRNRLLLHKHVHLLLMFLLINKLLLRLKLLLLLLQKLNMLLLLLLLLLLQKLYMLLLHSLLALVFASNAHLRQYCPVVVCSDLMALLRKTGGLNASFLLDLGHMFVLI